MVKKETADVLEGRRVKEGGRMFIRGFWKNPIACKLEEYRQWSSPFSFRVGVGGLYIFRNKIRDMDEW
jgi:hypothetical protein